MIRCCYKLCRNVNNFIRYDWYFYTVRIVHIQLIVFRTQLYVSYRATLLKLYNSVFYFFLLNSDLPPSDLLNNFEIPDEIMEFSIFQCQEFLKTKYHDDLDKSSKVCFFCLSKKNNIFLIHSNTRINVPYKIT